MKMKFSAALAIFCFSCLLGAQSVYGQCYIAIQADSSEGEFDEIVTSTSNGYTTETPLTIRDGFGTYCVRTRCPSRYSAALISFQQRGSTDRHHRYFLTKQCDLEGVERMIYPRDLRCFGSQYQCERNTDPRRILFITECGNI